MADRIVFKTQTVDLRNARGKPTVIACKMAISVVHLFTIQQLTRIMM